MRFVPWLAVSLIGIGCSSGLPVGHSDAGRNGDPDSGGADCGDLPGDGCGYVCQNGRWTPSLLLCLRDGGVSEQPDLAPTPTDAGLATADTESACVPVTSNDAGPVATCPCLRTQACPAGGPWGLACTDEGLRCGYGGGGNACGIVDCLCSRDDGGLHWECFILLH